MAGYQNYYPNFNTGYNPQPYAYQGYQPYQSVAQQPIQQQMPSQQLPQQPFQSSPTLYGKIVDGIDVVKSFDLPFNQTAIFPKADMSTIYVKSWCPDGTTQVIEYPRIQIIDEKKNVNDDITDTLLEIYNSIEDLSKKVDGLTNNKAVIPSSRKGGDNR